MTAQEISRKLEAAGLMTKIWAGSEIRIYVRDRGKDIGYLLESDDGSTGTCKHLTRRAGYVAGLLRA